MKANFKYAWLTLGSVVLLSSAAAIHGQPTTASVANVPFSFNVGEVRMPAATYRIAEMTTTGTTQIRNTENGHSIMVAALVPRGGEANSSKLVFRCYEGNCFLSEIWFQG